MVQKTPNEVFDDLLADLRQLARWFMAGERDGHTLQTDALLNEVWVRAFAGDRSLVTADRAEVLQVAARAMRNVLIDHARHRQAEKRGGKLRRVPLDDVLDRCATDGLDVVELKEALDDLERAHGLAATAFTLRFIAGSKVAEIAERLGKSEATIYGEIKLARGLLFARLARG